MADLSHPMTIRVEKLSCELLTVVRRLLILSDCRCKLSSVFREPLTPAVRHGWRSSSLTGQQGQMSQIRCSLSLHRESKIQDFFWCRGRGGKMHNWSGHYLQKILPFNDHGRSESCPQQKTEPFYQRYNPFQVTVCPKKQFFWQKSRTLQWRTVKKTKMFFVVFPKRLKISQKFQQIQVQCSKGYQLKNFDKNLMKSKSTLLKIRKKENFLYLGNPWRKKIHAKTFYFLKNSRNLW